MEPLSPNHTSLEHLRQGAFALLRAERAYRHENGLATNTPDPKAALLAAAMALAAQALGVMEASA